MTLGAEGALLQRGFLDLAIGPRGANAGTTAQAPGADCASFERAARRLARHRGLAVFAVGADVFGVTAQAALALSFAPPRLLICFDRDGSTFEWAKVGQSFALHAFDGDAADIANQHASVRPFRSSEREGPTFKRDDLAKIGSDRATASFRCRIEEVLDRPPALMLLVSASAASLAEAPSALIEGCGAYVPLTVERHGPA